MKPTGVVAAPTEPLTPAGMPSQRATISNAAVKSAEPSARIQPVDWLTLNICGRIDMKLLGQADLPPTKGVLGAVTAINAHAVLSFALITAMRMGKTTGNNREMADPPRKTKVGQNALGAKQAIELLAHLCNPGGSRALGSVPAHLARRMRSWHPKLTG